MMIGSSDPSSISLASAMHATPSEFSAPENVINRIVDPPLYAKKSVYKVTREKPWTVKLIFYRRSSGPTKKCFVSSLRRAPKCFCVVIENDHESLFFYYASD